MMTALPTTTAYPSARETGRAPQPARTTVRVEDRSSGDAATSSQVDAMPITMAFDLFLDAIALVKAGTRGGDGDKTLPSQMFEPNTADADKQRLTALKEEYRSGRANPSGDERFDRTSVDVRRALRSGRSGDAGQQSVTQRNEFSVARTGGGESASGGAASRLAGYGESLSVESAFTRPVGAELSPANAQATSPAISPAGAGGYALSAAPAVASPPAGQAVATVAPAGGASRLHTQNPAQQMVQLLGAGRAGEVESGRAPTSSAATANGRQATTDPKTTGRSSTGARTDGNPSSRQAAGTDAKASEVSRSPFDELVRSIRLQTGARRSSARMQLEPPELGRLYISIRVEGEQLRIDVRTETAAARELLSGRAEQLTAALEKHGIHVERFEVTTRTSEEHPTAWRDHEGVDAEAAADRERDPWDEAAPARAEVSLSEDTGASVVDDDAPEVGAVAETRLDIRV